MTYRACGSPTCSWITMQFRVNSGLRRGASTATATSDGGSWPIGPDVCRGACPLRAFRGSPAFPWLSGMLPRGSAVPRELDRCPDCRRALPALTTSTTTAGGWRPLDFGMILPYVEAAAPRVIASVRVSRRRGTVRQANPRSRRASKATCAGPCQRVTDEQTVNGHRFLPNCGHQISPLAAIFSPHRRP